MLIQIYNKGHVKTNAYNTTDLKETIELADKDISFTMPLSCIGVAENEGYIRTNKDEYVIKTVKPDKTDITIEAVLNLENLQGKPLESFSSVEKTIDDCIRLAIAGTGWTLINSGLTKKRTIRKDGTNALEIIKQALKTYICEVQFDSINKTIHFVEKRGTNKGSYAIEDFNNTAISLDSNSDKFFTYIIAYGKAKQDGTQIHCTVENHQYSDKMIGLYWKDERYTNIDSLREDATYKLNELSKPRKAYSVSADYFDNNIEIGDTITLISKDKNIKEKQRVTKIVKYLDEQGKDTIEVANTMLTFEDVQKEQQETTETVNNITEDNGTISLKAMQNGWIELNKVNVQDLNAIRANIGYLEANEVIADELHAHKASINDLTANKANITDLTASNLNFNTATGGTLDLQTLLARFVSGNLGQFLHLTGGNVVIDEEVVKDLIAAKISVGDLLAGNIDASRFNIVSQNGNLIINDNTIQIKDSNRVRIQIGKDASGDYTLNAWDKSGNLLFNSNGITKDAIKSKIIRDDMVADNANINGKKIDIDSLITEINNGTSIIKSSKIQLDTEGQTLDVAFNTLKSNVDNTQEQITANTTKIGVNQGKIDTLIKDTTITKDGKDITLKDAYSSLQQSVNGFETKVSNAKTEAIKTASTDATNKANQALADAKGYTNNSVNTVIERVTTAESSIEQLSDSITSKVSMTEVNNAINGIEIGGRNLLYHSDFSNITTLPYSYNGRNWRTASASDDSDLSRKVVDITTCPFIKKIKGVKIVSNKTTDNDMDVAQDKVIMEHSQVYTMSCYARLITGTGKIRLVYGKGSYFRQKYALTTEWKRYSFTFTYDKTKFSNKLTTNIFFGIEGKTLTGEICAFKLEKGTKVSDYTTAPEDTQTQIDNVVSRVSTAEQKITPDAIVSTVTTSETYKNNLNNKVDTSTYNSKVEQLSNSINSKVSTADFNTYKTQTAKEISSKVNSSDYNSKITQLDNSISTKVAKGDFGSMIQQNSDSVRVAFGDVSNGENLVRNSAGFLGTNNWYWWSSSDNAKFDTYNDGWLHIYNDTNSERCIAQGIYVNPNTTYTLSINVVTYNSTGCDVFIGGGTDSNNSWKYSRQVVNNYKGSVKSFKYTFTTKSDEKYITLRVDNNGVASGNDHRISFSGLKLEYGDKATPWCAHREEINNASVKMDNTGVEVLNGSITCKKGNNFTILNHGCLGFAEQTPNGYEEIVAMQSGYKSKEGQYINGVDLALLGKGDFISVGYTHDNYNDSILSHGSSTPIIQIDNPKWGVNSGEACHIHIFDDVEAYAHTFNIGTVKSINLEVSGVKHRVVETPYGTVGMNAVESCDALFEDVGDATTDENGICIVCLDPIFAETISTDIMYHVFLQKCGTGDIYVSERHDNYFVAKGTANLKFSWNIKAKQKSYSKDRCIDVDSRKEIDQSISNAVESITDLEKNADSIITCDILTDVDNLLKESEE